ncbi:hypothetical protein GRI58_01395 [Porphyrobacter algicida]|uniref:Uncharacterized protein n=1 Tax=Qipengyuania algicida TaxID=1836209 RepID=A0A845AFA1_9SPHN|nr:hypothetical protein [Qipengyuania algicida]MXP27475.1 hypothetical protein [Qipengyuania algicida]
MGATGSAEAVGIGVTLGVASGAGAGDGELFGGGAASDDSCTRGRCCGLALVAGNGVGRARGLAVGDGRTDFGGTAVSSGGTTVGNGVGVAVGIAFGRIWIAPSVTTGPCTFGLGVGVGAGCKEKSFADCANAAPPSAAVETARDRRGRRRRAVMVSEAKMVRCVAQGASRGRAE